MRGIEWVISVVRRRRRRRRRTIQVICMADGRKDESQPAWDRLRTSVNEIEVGKESRRGWGEGGCCGNKRLATHISVC